MKLREAAEAVESAFRHGCIVVGPDLSDGGVRETVRLIDNLRAALAEPDELAEAERLLKRTSRFLQARELADGDLYADIDSHLSRTARHEGT